MTSCLLDFFMSLARLLSLAGLLYYCIVAGSPVQDSLTSATNSLQHASKYFKEVQLPFLEISNEASQGLDDDL